MSQYAVGIDLTADSQQKLIVDIRDGAIVDAEATGPIIAVGVAIADGVTPDLSALNLPAGVPVVTVSRERAAVAGAGVASPSTMVINPGTGVHLMNSRVTADVPGVATVSDGFLPGYVGYAVRQPPVGEGAPAMEAAAMRLATVCDAIRSAGVPVRRFVAIGPERNNSHLMQIYADVLAEKIAVAASDQPVALGAAIHAALSAGSAITRHAAMSVTVRAMAHQLQFVYRPDIDARRTYAKLRASPIPPRPHL
jgi:ribulose kinase